MRLRKARQGDVAPLLVLINGYAQRGLLLERSEESLRGRLADFLVAEDRGQVVGCGALTALGPGLGEVRSLAVREDRAGHGLGRRIVERLLAEAAGRGFTQVLALTRRVPFFAALGFEVTQRERFLDKLIVDCKACPLNLCCDETAMVRPVAATQPQATGGERSGIHSREASGGSQGGPTQGPPAEEEASGGSRGRDAAPPGTIKGAILE